MGNLISNIENMRIHDASSVHGIIPNASSYSVVIGDPSSVYTEQKEVGLPVDLESMLVNLTPNLVLRDTSDADIEVYNKVEMDYVLGT